MSERCARSDSPCLSIACFDKDARPSLAGNKLKRQRDDLALDGGCVRLCGERRGDQPTIVQTQKLELPRVALNQKQFAHANARMKVELLTAAIVGAEDLNCEIGAAEPVCITIIGRA